MNNDDVKKEEELLRNKILLLSDENRKVFYENVEKQIKDPDTYAALNFLFLTGIHHFYLQKWLKGTINLSLFVFGLILLFGSTFSYGFGLGILLAVFILELNELFRSQIIVQDYNNKVLEKNLELFK
ncbi:TM2 domain-containing protein [Poseidonibacter antarcticus]|uniref:TM2 domain-containing protein n=1 Tax=Poseidonibacter antarcticus TaxID=2478538 RepID=UPI000EF50371|nr:TM2 domain-containing protein [Poseidonibacter antarcticus]